MTWPAGYKMTVNESETITVAQPKYSLATDGPGAVSQLIERS
ncbi:MAG: hypothetical protein JWQ24_3570 [Tardiphaga sp.]|nr:hypothetical protein [Tardiphaga sp.]